MTKGIKILPDGSTSFIEFVGLADMQEVVGGLIERVAMPHLNYDVYVNEEGLPMGLPINVLASLMTDRRLVGTVLVTGPVDEDGDLTSVSNGIMKGLAQVSAVMEREGVPPGHARWDGLQDA